MSYVKQIHSQSTSTATHRPTKLFIESILSFEAAERLQYCICVAIHRFEMAICDWKLLHTMNEMKQPESKQQYTLKFNRICIIWWCATFQMRANAMHTATQENAQYCLSVTLESVRWERENYMVLYTLNVFANWYDVNTQAHTHTLTVT